MKETSSSGKQKKLNRGGEEMLIPDLIIQLITVVIGVMLYAAIFKILKNIIYKIIH